MRPLTTLSNATLFIETYGNLHSHLFVRAWRSVSGIYWLPVSSCVEDAVLKHRRTNQNCILGDLGDNVVQVEDGG